MEYLMFPNTRYFSTQQDMNYIWRIRFNLFLDSKVRSISLIQNQNQNQNNSIEMSKNKIGIQVWSKCKQWIELQAMNHSATQGYLQTEKEMNCILENYIQRTLNLKVMFIYLWIILILNLILIFILN